MEKENEKEERKGKVGKIVSAEILRTRGKVGKIVSAGVLKERCEKWE